MQRNKKVAFISHSQYFHGAEICLLESVKALINRGHCEVHVIIPGITETHLGKELRHAGATVHPVIANPRWVDYPLKPGRRLKWWKETLRAFTFFIKFLRTERPDIVISNSIVNNPAFAIAAKLLGHRFVWYIHELGDADHEYTFYAGRKLSFRIIRLLSDKIIFNSLFTLQYFAGAKPHKKNRMLVLDYVVDQERMAIPADQPPIDKFRDTRLWKILIAGRTVKGKGQEDIINALGILKNKYNVTNFQLTVLGQTPGPYLDHLNELIREHQLSDHIRVIGFIEDPARYFQEAHIGVTTSRNEAFGRITVEYMKSNMIAIGANAGATGEIISNQQNGLLYTVKKPDELADILRAILTGNMETAALRRNAATMTRERFSEEKHAYALTHFLFE